jgi:hypothetical protein
VRIHWECVFGIEGRREKGEGEEEENEGEEEVVVRPARAFMIGAQPQHHATQHYATQHHATQHYATQRHAIPQRTTQHYNAPRNAHATQPQHHVHYGSSHPPSLIFTFSKIRESYGNN